MTALPPDHLALAVPAWTTPQPAKRSRASALFLQATPGRTRRKPVLTIEEERACVDRCKASADPSELWPLVLAQRGFVRRLALKFKKWGIALEDLEQSAMLGMFQVAPRFDPDRGARFISFAGWHARAALQHLILSPRSDVSICEHTGHPIGLAALSGDPEGIAARCGLSPAKLSAVMHWRTGNAIPIDEPSRTPDADPGETTLAERFADTRPSPEDTALSGVHDEHVRAVVHAALSILDDRARAIVAARLLVADGDEAPSLKEVAAAHGISADRVRQIEARSIEKLIPVLKRAGALRLIRP